MKLPPRDARILAHSELRALLPATNLAQALKIPATQVQYTLRRMRERKLIQLRPFVDVHLSGFLDLAFYLSCNSQTAAQARALREYLIQHEMVISLTALAGEFYYRCVLYTPHLASVSAFFDALANKFPQLASLHQCCPRLKYIQFPRRYLSAENVADEFTTAVTTKKIEIDEIDSKILKILAQGSYDSFRDAAQQVKMPASTFDKRVDRLMLSGIIKGFYWDIDTTQLGVQSYALLIEMHATTQQQRALEKYVSTQRNVTII
jgi:DNA-binding Lrp family transcriptional regulator